MSISARVLSAMSFDREYSPEDIAAQCHIKQEDAGRYLHLLAKGGVVECVKPDRFRKNRKYKTRQRSLFA